MVCINEFHEDNGSTGIVVLLNCWIVNKKKLRSNETI